MKGAKVYSYNSIEYKEKIKEFDVSLEQAEKLVDEFYLLHYPNKQKIYIRLDFVFDDFYVFPTFPFYVAKTKSYYLSGIWINGKTGNVIEKQTDNYNKIFLDIPFSNSNSFRKTIIR